MASSWIANSMVKTLDTSNENGLLFPGVVILIAVNICILAHSLKTHGNPLVVQFDPLRRSFPLLSLKTTSTRLKTETAALGVLGCCLMMAFAATARSKFEYAIYHNVVSEGCFSVLIQLCDVYMFYDRLRAVISIPLWKRWAIQLYIWVVLVFSWAPVYTIYPFFVDTNTVTFRRTFYNLTFIYCWGSFLFNMYMSLEACFVLQNIYRRVSSDNANLDFMPSESPVSPPLKTMKSIALRSIIHAMTSSCAALAYHYVQYPFGSYIYTVTIPLGMHILFNVDWWTNRRSTPSAIALSRDTREQVALRGRLTTIARMLQLVNDETETMMKVYPESAVVMT